MFYRFSPWHDHPAVFLILLCFTGPPLAWSTNSISNSSEFYRSSPWHGHPAVFIYILCFLQIRPTIHDNEVAALSNLFSPSTLETVAQWYFNLTEAEIGTFKARWRENIEGFKRELLHIFRNKGHCREVKDRLYMLNKILCRRIFFRINQIQINVLICEGRHFLATSIYHIFRIYFASCWRQRLMEILKMSTCWKWRSCFLIRKQARSEDTIGFFKIEFCRICF